MAAVGTPQSRTGAWWLAARPATLTAAVAPVLVGIAVVARDGAARPLAAGAALLTALLLQIGANFANDLFDFEKGADTEERLGPTRAVQSGLLSPSQMRTGTLWAFGAAALAGLVLVALGGWPIAVLGALAIAAGLGYTAGPWPLGYHGLGDLTVFFFFGVVAVAGTGFVQTHHLSALALAAALPMGFLVTSILAVNNLRDIDTDVRAGKRTLAVRMGRTNARRYTAALIGGAYPALAVLGIAFDTSAGILLPLLTLPWAARLMRTVLSRDDAPSLNGALVGCARLHAGFGTLLALGLLS